MPVYLSPGVYVEEIPPKARSVAGVGTSTACFLGVVPVTVTMPLKPVKPGETQTNYTLAAASKPIPITSWEEFKNNFGDFQAKKPSGGDGGGNATDDENFKRYQYLQHAVYGFFNNGGTVCWVMRVASSTDITGATKLKAQLDKFAPIDEIAIVVVPGATTKDDHETIMAHCEELEDRFAVLDGVPISDPVNATVAAIALSARSKTASYGAIYFPWLKVSDPLSTTPALVVVPPSGHVAGIYARSDSARGAYKAPANEDVIGALDLDCPLTKAKQATLNPDGINVIRSFNGAIKVWGARTRADEANSQFRYISTRRYFNFLRESIDEATQFAVFEPNTPNLWQTIVQTVSGFLLNQWREGALFGSTPDQAFFVKCDKDTNPPEVRELGQVVTEIGVAIVKPAEFVIFRIQQTTGG